MPPSIIPTVSPSTWDPKAQRKLTEFQQQVEDLRARRESATVAFFNEFLRLPRSSHFGTQHMKFMVDNAHEIRAMLAPFDHNKRPEGDLL